MITGELFRLLHALGVEGMDEQSAWSRVAIVHNYEIVPAERTSGSFGFKLLVLDHLGRPEWFGRCSWAAPEAMVREAALLDALTHDPIAQQHVPETRAAQAAPLFLQISRHLGVRAYGDEVVRLAPGRWSADLIDAITTCAVVMERALLLVPQLKGMVTTEARRADYAASLNTVTPATRLSERQHHALASVADVIVGLPRVLQHGDLWPANLLRRNDRWWLIDFAECGHVMNPLYDVFHMVHAAPRGGGGPWYALGAAEPDNAWRRAQWAVVEHFARAQGLDDEQVGACLVFYLVHLAAYRLRPGVSLMWSEGLRRDVERVAGFLDGGGTLATLLR